ncbi:MAG: hypothetical protein ACT4OY_00775 [Alphaproteobacteria bacterium]
MNQSLRKNYDVAAENELRLFEVLRFYLYLEQRPNGPATSPDQIPDKAVSTLFDSPARLPQAFRNYLHSLIQDFEGDFDAVLSLNMPTGLEKYFVKIVLLKKKKQEDRDRIIAAFLKSFVHYCDVWFKKGRVALEVAQAHYLWARQEIDDEIAHLTKQEARQFSDIEKDMDRIKEHLAGIKAKLTDSDLENVDQLIKINEEIVEDDVKISTTKIQFEQRLKILRPYWQKQKEAQDYGALEDDIIEETAPEETGVATTTPGYTRRAVSYVGQSAVGAVRSGYETLMNRATTDTDEETGDTGTTGNEAEPPVDEWAEFIEEPEPPPNNDPDD